mmetsp:Transcript_36049/g.44007  ORF Transcript_36049/g.44007 Transcript_36049/m.44007 type:complete len:83 (-) Transcript_36049:459-707(-)
MAWGVFVAMARALNVAAASGQACLLAFIGLSAVLRLMADEVGARVLLIGVHGSLLEAHLVVTLNLAEIYHRRILLLLLSLLV